MQVFPHLSLLHVPCLVCGARDMLTSNLCVDMGLVNGAIGTVVAICYRNGESPPNLPIAVPLKFDSYGGPTLFDVIVPVTPLRCTWFPSCAFKLLSALSSQASPAVTIHKSQKIVLYWIIICCLFLCYQLKDFHFDPPFPFQCMANLANSQRQN